jgi:mono/diheme cytochrome c family protein
MSACDGFGPVVGNRGRLRLTRQTPGRVLRSIGILATASLFVTACTPSSDSPPPDDEMVGVDVASPSPGQTYAEAACASCHAVLAGDTNSPNPRAPTFDMIANVPGMTLMALNAMLTTSHKTMPNLIIEPARIEDLSAYLRTLKR